jgi:hypothetical protein
MLLGAFLILVGEATVALLEGIEYTTARRHPVLI